MKHIFKKIIYVLSVTLLFIGCSTEENNPFSGTDNHISVFSLKIDDTTYIATITGDKITIQAPVNISLSGAKAQYELCEQASILPNPSEITDWDSEQTFRVKSYTGESRNYTYSIIRSEVCHTGNVSLQTQADVDTFIKSGFTVIDGNLIIGSVTTTDSKTAITHLEGLSSLKEVKYHIIINNSFAGSELKGLDNVEKCGGFYIGSLTSQATFTKNIAIFLPSLTISGDIIFNSDSIKSIALPRLESVGNLLISSKIIQKIEIPALKEVVKNLSVKNASNITNTSLTEAKFPELTSVGGSIALQYFSGLEKTEFSKLTYVGGDIDVSLNSASFEELNFPALETTNGTINIERAPGLLKINFPKVKKLTSFIYNKVSYGNYPLINLNLSSLETIADEFYIRNIPIEVLSLPKLQSIKGNISISGLQSMKTFDIPVMTQIKGKLYLSSANLLPSLDLSKLTEIGSIELVGCLLLKSIQSPKEIGSITINCASNATCPIPVFEGLETIKELMSFTSCNNTSIFNIKNIRKIASFKLNDGIQGSTLTFPDAEEIGTLEIGTYKLAELSAPKLTKVKDFKLSNIWSLITINVPLLKTIDSFYLAEHGSWNTSNAHMTDLNAFIGVTSIQRVKIEYCAKLTNYTGLKNVIHSLTANNWSVTGCKYNPSYQDMVNGKFSE